MPHVRQWRPPVPGAAHVALKPRVMQKSFGGTHDRKLLAKLRKLRKVIADEERHPAVCGL